MYTPPLYFRANLFFVVILGPQENDSAGQDIFSARILAAEDSRKMNFLQTMHMFSSKEAKAVLENFEFSKYSKICDLGGKHIIN